MTGTTHAADTLSGLGGVRLVGEDIDVVCADGRSRRYLHLDHAASTPALIEVWQEVQDFLPWYSSVHRGTGAKSRHSTEVFESTRAVVAVFVGARPQDQVVLVRNTTEAINVLSGALPHGTRVLSTPVEHHANMLPWRRHHVELLPFPGSADELCEACETALRDAVEPFDLVAVTGASNVTGEVWPLRRLAQIAHRYGARLFVDAAQLAPHRAIDMAATGIDLLAFSGHKLYAPFGAGALVGDLQAIAGSAPFMRGGGAVKLVTVDQVIWETGPERHEAGSPNVVGAVALAAACRTLSALGLEEIARHERALTARLRGGLRGVPGLETLTLWSGDDVDRLGVVTFQLAGYRHPHVAAVLGAEHAIGVRNGCFCAHLLIAQLLDVSSERSDELAEQLRADEQPELPGAVRASVGLGTTPADVDRLLQAVDDLARHGPQASYRYLPEHDEYECREASWRPGR